MLGKYRHFIISKAKTGINMIVWKIKLQVHVTIVSPQVKFIQINKGTVEFCKFQVLGIKTFITKKNSKVRNIGR